MLLAVGGCRTPFLPPRPNRTAPRLLVPRTLPLLQQVTRASSHPLAFLGASEEEEEEEEDGGRGRGRGRDDRVVGISGKPEKLLNVEAVSEDNIPMIKRSVGE